MKNLENTPNTHAIRTQLAKILSSEVFSTKERLRRFLSFVVEEDLNGRAGDLKEYAIGLEVFGKDKDFDPRNDTVVRTAAARLRDGLADYYQTEGKDDPLLIELPKGHYVPKVTVRNALPVRKFPIIQLLLAAALMVAVVAGASLWRVSPSGHTIQKEARPRRLFAQSTSEGHAPRLINTGQIHSDLVIGQDGKKLYAISARSITVLDAENLHVKRTIDLPFPPFRPFLSHDGKRIYISAYTPEAQVMVIDTSTDRVVEQIPTGSPAFGIAVTPDEKKLFLALGFRGLKVIDLDARASRIVSPLACPLYLDLDPVGRRLYVSYQSGGPGGSPGHDAVDIYDVDSEKSIDVIKGLPLVGNIPTVSPGGNLVLLDGGNACSSPEYDHIGCPTVPSYILHLWQVSDRRVIATIPPQISAMGKFFPQGTRLLFRGSDVAVWDWARKMVLERISSPPTGFGAVAISPASERAFLATTKVPGLLVFDAEMEECLPPIHGLTNFYSGDGTLDDSQANGSLISTSTPQFAPGRLGQAIRFNGKDSFLKATGASSFCPYCLDSWTESVWVKFESTAGDMTIMDQAPGHKSWARRMYKSENNHIVLQGDDGQEPRLLISSVAAVEAGRWYHLAVVTGEDHVFLYINGILQGQTGFIGIPPRGKPPNVFFGASAGKQNFLKGLIDEVSLYSRALSSDEVKTMAKGCSAEHSSEAGRATH